MIPADSYYPQFVWQGVYVFNVDLTNGITIKGNITQLDNASAYLANPSLAVTGSYPWGKANTSSTAHCTSAMSYTLSAKAGYN